MSTEWFILDSGRCAAGFNMAADEALLEAMPAIGRPVLRFYGWMEPAASFGYFQRYGEVEKLTLLRPLVRRPTGGGIVPHDGDWTYSLTVPIAHPWHGLRAVESYRAAHEWIRAAFARLHVETELAPEPRKSLPGQCFAGYEVFDVLWKGRKIAGAAQRRTRTGLLIQGSVQPPPLKLDRSEFCRAMCECVPAGCKPERFTLGGQLRSRIEALAEAKYGQAAYNQKR